MINKQAFKQIVGKDYIHDDPQILEGFSRDHSYTEPMKPDLIVQPGNTNEVQQIIKLAKKNNIKLVPVSSGSPRFRGDTVPSVLNAVVVDLCRMKELMWVNRRNRVALIEAGVTFGELEKALEREGLRGMMPLLPRKNKSIVGAYMEREPFTIPKYAWDSGDPVASAEIVFGDGKIMRTGGAAGPAPTLEAQRKIGGAQKLPISPFMMDAKRIVQGTQGSMGICTWMALRCELLPEYEKIYFSGSNDLAELITFSNRLLYVRLTDEQFILNSLNFACLFETDPVKIASLRSRLPEYILVTSIGGYGSLPKDQIEYKDMDLRDEAKHAGMELTDSIGGITEEDYKEKVLRKVSDEGYWKLRFKGDVREIFFLAPIARAPEFIRAAKTMAEKFDFASSNTGIYIQSVIQGAACHIEMDLFMDEGETEKNKPFYVKLSKNIHEMGGYFSRPYDVWPDIVYPDCPTFVKYARGLKKIFDPCLIMNPGKTCFKEMGNES